MFSFDNRDFYEPIIIMKLFYYVKDSQRMGPFTYSQLEAEGITPDTLVWFEGLQSWQFAKDLSELNEIFVVKAPEPIVESQPLLPVVESKDIQSLKEEVVKEEVETNQNAIAEPMVESEPVFINTKQGLFSNPFGIKGRIRRTEYWLSVLIFYIYIAIIGSVTGGIEYHASDESALLMVLFCIPAYWFIIVQNAKRCHDRGNSGWYQLIPFYSLWMAFAEGDFTDNEYGPNPKR